MEVFNELYPGNLSVMENLIAAIGTEGVVAFTGAGTSIPELPSWHTLVNSLIQGAQESGLIDSPTADALRAEDSDFLYVIDEIYGCAGETQTKIKVCDIFKGLKSPTDSHRAIMSTRFKKILTLNYDVGLEMAHSAVFSSHLANITVRNEHEVHDWNSSHTLGSLPPILHWHGLASDTNSIILSGSDYATFYEKSVTNKNLLRSLFLLERCALVGFGFTDPFIAHQLNSVMQPLPSANKHFAILGVQEGAQFNCVLERRRFASKYKLEVVFYPIRENPTGNEHAALQSILVALQEKCRRCGEPDAEKSSKIVSHPTVTEDIQSYRSSLFEISGRKIYCEPNLWSQAVSAEGSESNETKVSVAEIVCGSYHCVISAPHEFGLTNLGRRLSGELILLGVVVVQRDATDLPSYRKKILQDIELSKLQNAERSTIVIDNYSPIDHRRLVRELLSCFPQARIIALQRASFGNDVADENPLEASFRFIKLDGLTRSDIRSIIQSLSPNWHSDVTSTAVDKVYTDLLQLCIPLTPSNVIMYASVLCRDESFVPVSRLHIVERFVAEALQRASDAYSESFNYINKVDVLSEFCYKLFEENKFFFDLAQWSTFCRSYKKENLVDFDHIELINDLANGRIISRFNNNFYFKYRMFFSYFVGRRIASDPLLLEHCLQANRHLELDGLVEVLCGTLSDCSEVLTNITDKLERSMETFYQKYPLNGLDFHAQAKWEITDQEDNIWKMIAEKIEEGPTGITELDQLKTSLAAERRTADQTISILNFIVSESSVAIRASQLRTAIESAKNAKAVVKLSSIDSVIRSYALTYEVATIFAPLIAEKKYFSWNGFSYINLIENSKEGTSEEVRARMLRRVLSALPTSMADNASESFGNRKLGQVFLALFKDTTKPAIYRLIVLALLLRSKPSGWLDAAKEMITSMKRDELYLRHCLTRALAQLKNEVNSSNEVAQLREFIAAIKLRRDRNVRSPNKEQISKAIKQLADKNYFANDE
jgi:hypothetical protein